MSAAIDILTLLDQLCIADREWIIDQLSPREKLQLLHREQPDADRNGHPAAVRARQAQANTQARNGNLNVIVQADPAAVAGMLEHEPAWLSAEVLRAGGSTWSSQVLQAITAAHRLEVERCLQSSSAFTEQMVQALLSLLVARLAQLTHVAADSKFDALVGHIAASRRSP